MAEKSSSLVRRWFVDNWVRKLVAIITSICIWVVVSQNITASADFKIEVVVKDLPEKMTVVGLRKDKALQKKILVTIRGNGDYLKRLKPLSLSLDIDASNAQLGYWVPEVTKKSLTSKSTDEPIDLRQIISVTAPDLKLEVCNIAKYPVPIHVWVMGDPPGEYTYIDHWPKKIFHELEGPETEMNQLRINGIELVISLSEIRREDLDDLQKIASTTKYPDEISYMIPDDRKVIKVPFMGDDLIPINGIDATELHIDFLAQKDLAITHPLPIIPFFKTLSSTQAVSFKNTDFIENKGAYGILKAGHGLLMEGGSSRFLDVVKDNLQISFIQDPTASYGFVYSFNILDHERLRKKFGETYCNPCDNEKEQYYNDRFLQYLGKFKIVSPTELTALLRQSIKIGGIKIL